MPELDKNKENPIVLDKNVLQEDYHKFYNIINDLFDDTTVINITNENNYIKILFNKSEKFTFVKNLINNLKTSNLEKINQNIIVNFKDCIFVNENLSSDYDYSSFYTFIDLGKERYYKLKQLSFENIIMKNSLRNFFYFNNVSCMIFDVENISFKNIEIENNDSLMNMFNGCISLTTLNLSNFDTSNVTNMKRMFICCSGLKTLDLSDFDTNNVADMSYMFCNCCNLKTLDLSNFVTTNVTNMKRMFHCCCNLKTLDLSNFETSKVTNMEYMFACCSGLTTLDLSNYDTSNVLNMAFMFKNCRNLTTLDLSSFKTTKVTDMFNMFEHCTELTRLDLSNFDTSNVTDMRYMFRNCYKLKTIKIPSSCLSDDFIILGKNTSYDLKDVFGENLTKDIIYKNDKEISVITINKN